jgi:hypothetical protein
MAAVVLVIAMGAFEEGQAAPKCAVLLCPPGRGPAAAGPLVLRRIGGLRLRGGADGLNDSMRDEDDDGAGSEVDDGAESHVPVAVQNTCFGRNEFFNASVDADMLVKDLKRELYANYSTRVCDPEQMEVWWAGKELKGLSHDTLRSYGFSPPAAGAAGAHAGSPERLVVKQKFLFSPQFAGEATKRQQQRGGAQMGLGGQQAQLAAMHNARMQALLQDPAELNKLMQSPEFQQILASNPEVQPPSARRRLCLHVACVARLCLQSAPCAVCACAAQCAAEVPQETLTEGVVMRAQRGRATGGRDAQGPRDAATHDAGGGRPGSNALHA